MTKKSTRPVSLKETLKNRPPARKPVIEDLIDRGQMVILAGRPNVGKTPFLSQMASSVAVGADFLGFETHPHRVAIIDLESDASRYLETAETQWKALGIDPIKASEGIDLFVRGNPNDPNSESLEQALLEDDWQKRLDWLGEHIRSDAYGLVIIDPLLALFPFKAADEEKVRKLLSEISSIKRQSPYPAILFSHHLRKEDRRSRGPTLLKDPAGWSQEILGSMVWSASTDVRLGLESLPSDEVVFSGFRRAEGELPRVIMELRIEVIHGNPTPTCWDRCNSSQLVSQILTKNQRTYFNRLPVGQWVSWSEFLKVTCAGRSTAHRLIDRAKGGLIEHDIEKKSYRRVV